MTRTLLCCVLSFGCHTGPREAANAPRPAQHAAPRQHHFARCSEGGRVEALGAPLSDDLSGLVADGELLWTHTDARRRRPTIFALRPDHPAEAALTLTMPGSVVDPEDLARADGVTYLADTGDNAGPGRCFRYAHRDGACALTEVLELEEEPCLAEQATVWVRRTIADDREPYRIHALALGEGTVRTLAVITWSRYPAEECHDPQCRLAEHSALFGRFDTEALFARREPAEDGTMGTSLYLVTKEAFPLAALVRLQRDEACTFEHESRALVFRIANVGAMHGTIDIGGRIERVAAIELGVDDALEAQITGAALAEEDLVLLSRSRTLRWHVPSSVSRIDQSFFDAHPPCVAASPELADAPKLEGIALGPIEGGMRTWYAVSEEGDFAREGAEALFRLSERWSYGAR